jgi:hypothetical protein
MDGSVTPPLWAAIYGKVCQPGSLGGIIGKYVIKNSDSGGALRYAALRSTVRVVTAEKPYSQVVPSPITRCATVIEPSLESRSNAL